MTIVEILRGAKVELARRGLHKGWFFKNHKVNSNVGGQIPDGPCCVFGACIAAAGDWSAAEKAEPVLWLASKRCDVADYNDERGIKVTHLQALLDRAIALAEAQS